MPRGPRVRGKSGYYHVMMRGIGRIILCEDTGDRQLYLGLLKKTLDKDFAIHSWCLMPTDIHLLVHDPKGVMSGKLQYVNQCYAQYYNGKTGHVGHVFQSRFLSKPIDDERYLLRVLNYIHQNPHVDHIAPMDDYQWSSYRAYATGYDDGLTTVEPILSLIGGRENFEAFSQTDVGEYNIKPRPRKPLSDGEARIASMYALDWRGPELLGEVSVPVRDNYLRRMRDAGITINQAERLTGLGRSLIGRVFAVKTKATWGASGPVVPTW